MWAKSNKPRLEHRHWIKPRRIQSLLPEVKKFSTYIFSQKKTRSMYSRDIDSRLRLLVALLSTFHNIASRSSLTVAKPGRASGSCAQQRSMSSHIASGVPSGRVGLLRSIATWKTIAAAFGSA